MKKVLWIFIGAALLVTAVQFVGHRQNATPASATDPTSHKTVNPPASIVGVGKSQETLSAPEFVSTAVLPVLSDAVKTLLSTNTPFVIRSEITKKLSRDLSADDVIALRNFLNAPLSDFPSVKPIALNSLKNDILEVLMDQRRMPDGLGQQVVDMFNNPSTDYMWREYSLQFMAPFLSKGMSSIESAAARGYGETGKGTPNSQGRTEEMKTVESALFGALDDRSKELAGTALLGLDRLAKKYEQFDRKGVLVKAVEIAKDPNASAVCRLTAMRVASSGGNADVLSAARELAQNGQTDLLRGAAITTLGDFGAPEDMELLKTLSFSPNRQIAAAAQAALNRNGI